VFPGESLQSEGERATLQSVREDVERMHEILRRNDAQNRN